MKKDKKICIITTISLSIKSFFLEQIDYLSKSGYDVTIICNTDNELENLLNCDVKYIPITMKRGLDPMGSIKSIYSMIKIFRQNQFDIIQYSTPNASLYASIAAKLSGNKISLYHNMGFRYAGSTGIKRKILKYLEKITCLLSTEIQTVSFSNLEFGIKENLFKREKSRVIWNGSTGGVDLDKFDISKKLDWKNEIYIKHNISSEKFIFGFVGRITKEKGINEILEAYKELCMNNNDTMLIMVGQEENVNSIEKKLYNWAKKNENILFIGHSNEVYKYLSAFNVLLLPSYREGFGNVVIESQAMGVPVIVSDIPGPTDAIKKNVTGLVVSKQNSKELLDKMEYVYINKKLCKNMGDNAHKYIKSKFDSKELVKHILEDKNRILAKYY
ncbi:group 1 glycosyl transferase [[Clostridium] sordellii]|uniref:glycosyltransferase family 4 protein n=1 Tax=Paraclostridium sordellii TaxID=1505 RepID=UPI0005DB1AB0|nr:glycosyltransferase family 4 protein [Paeniclostridium sordellii]CEN76506.1 group 1 glycosyl transferase [[Clostridium] sordellii] [Paeniclostridium sordellii]